MDKDYFDNIEDDDIISTINFFISKHPDKNDMIVVGVYLPFGNSAYTIVDKEEVKEIIKHLKDALQEGT